MPISLVFVSPCEDLHESSFLLLFRTRSLTLNFAAVGETSRHAHVWHRGMHLVVADSFPISLVRFHGPHVFRPLRGSDPQYTAGSRRGFLGKLEVFFLSMARWKNLGSGPGDLDCGRRLDGFPSLVSFLSRRPHWELMVRLWERLQNTAALFSPISFVSCSSRIVGGLDYTTVDLLQYPFPQPPCPPHFNFLECLDSSPLVLTRRRHMSGSAAAHLPSRLVSMLTPRALSRPAMSPSSFPRFHMA